MKVNPEIFKAYDVRAVYPTELNAEVARLVGQAYAVVYQPQKIAVGRDVRASGEELKKELIEGLVSSGVDVADIGTITTDQLYFAVGKYGFDGGISVTASHNPSEYNGFKFAERGGGPITSERLESIRDRTIAEVFEPAKSRGQISTQPLLDDYVEHILSFIESDAVKPLKVVANANFGAAGRAVDKVANHRLKLTLDKLNWEENGAFPKGPPNPLLPENREETSAQIKKTGADLGVAWDADADRVFFFDGQGQFIPSCYIIALIAAEFIKHFSGAKIVHDITLCWVIDDAVKKAGGQPIINRVGHTFIKARMRQEDAPFAAESSGHYYFRDNFSADNGIVPFLMVLQMISKSGKSLEDLVAPLKKNFFVSDEINFKVANPTTVIKLLEDRLTLSGEVDKTDGLSITTTRWRFNARPSNTEPLLRLNAEAKSQDELKQLVSRITVIIKSA